MKFLMDLNSFEALATIIGLAIVVLSSICGIIIYMIRQEGKVNIMAEQLKQAHELIEHLIDEGKNFKLVQGGFSNDNQALRVTVARIEEKQDSASEDIKEIKQLLTKRN